MQNKPMAKYVGVRSSVPVGYKFVAAKMQADMERWEKNEKARKNEGEGGREVPAERKRKRKRGRERERGSEKKLLKYKIHKILFAKLQSVCLASEQASASGATDEKSAEETKRESEKLFSGFFNNFPNIFVRGHRTQRTTSLQQLNTELSFEYFASAKAKSKRVKNNATKASRRRSSKNSAPTTKKTKLIHVHANCKVSCCWCCCRFDATRSLATISDFSF